MDDERPGVGWVGYAVFAVGSLGLWVLIGLGVRWVVRLVTSA